MEKVIEFFTNIDWQTTISTLKDLATLVVALVGLQTINVWRKQMVESDQYKLAKDISLLTIRIKDKLANTRIHGDINRQISFESKIELTKSSWGVWYKDNFNKLFEMFSQLETLEWESEVLGMIAIEEERKYLHRISGDRHTAFLIVSDDQFADEIEKNQIDIIWGYRGDSIEQDIDNQINIILKKMSRYVRTKKKN